MAFRKQARVQTLGWGEAGDGFCLTAAAEGFVGLEGEPALVKPRSYYLDGARKLDVRDLLSRVAETYAINADPASYFFEAIRANTTNAPNENNDAFHQSELLRFDVKLGMPVYRTYAGKPHHLNHRTENPKAARGVIIDAHYNSDSPALEHCPGCQIRTAERVNRDETGLHCKKCGTLVRDEFVEILVGIDTTKDPLFAEGVRKGTLKAGSMGCNCLSTTCNVCNHVAYARPDFCEHIRAGNKGSIWVRKGSGWTKSNARDVGNELRRRKQAFVSQDFCYAKADGFEARRAFENCNYVIFDEYSRVDQPADPKALQVEILKAASVGWRAPTPEALLHETQELIRSATKKRQAMEASMQRAAANRQALGTPGPNMPYVSGDLDVEGVGLQMGPDGKPVVELDDPNEPLVIQPPGMTQQPGGPPPGPGGPGGPGGPETIQQFTDQQIGPPGQPPAGEQLNPAELGFGTGQDQQMGLPKQTSSAPPRTGGRRPNMRTFGNAYAKWTVEVTEQGNAMLRAADKTPVLVIKAASPTQDPEERKAFGKAVLASLFDEGLVGTAKKYRAFFSPRFAQVVDHAVDDFVGFTDKYMHDSVLEGGTQNDMGWDKRETAPTDTREEASQGDDMEGDVRDYGSPHKDVLVDGVADNDVRPEGFESPVKEDNEAMREKRKMIDVGQNSVLQDEVHDHVEPVSGKKGQAERKPVAPAPMSLRIGTRLQESAAAQGAPRFYTVAAKIETAKGRVVDLLPDGGGKVRRVAAEDLLQKWIMLDKTPAQVRRPGQAAKVCGAEGCKTFVSKDAEYCGSHQNMGKEDDGEKTARAGTVSRMPVAAAAVNDEVARRVKQAERLEKFAQAKLERTKRELAEVRAQAEAEKQALGKGTVESYCRAMRIAARRMQADLEQAPLKLAAEAILSEPRSVGRDAATGQPIVYRGLDPDLTRYLVAQLYEVGHADHLEQLMKRAAELMTKGDQYLLDAEADLKNVRTALPELTNSRVAEIDEAGLHAASLRRRASGGNLQFSPAPTPEEGAAVGNGHDKRAAIRGALGGTLVEAARGRLGLN